MEDDRGSTPRGASARGRAGEPAAQPARATGRPPAAIFMEPAIPAPREAEPDTARQREPEAPAQPAAGRESERAPTPAAAPHAKAAAVPAKAAPARASAEPTKAAPTKAAPTKAAPTKAPEPAKAPAPAKAAAPAKAKAAKATAPAKTAAPSKTAKATEPATATPAKATASKTAKAATTTTATTTTAARATTPAQDDPPVNTQLEPPARDAATDPRPVPALWDRVRAEPRQAPELLARAAVERYGPEADRYTRWIRATYPAASDDRIAQAAARRFTAKARQSALAAVVSHGAGEVAALSLVQARMVLHIAAAYRLDPAAPERAAELLTLMRPARVPLGAGVRAVGRGLATRLVPGAGLLLGALLNDADTGSLARRAISLYKPVPRLP